MSLFTRAVNVQPARASWNALSRGWWCSPGRTPTWQHLSAARSDAGSRSRTAAPTFPIWSSEMPICAPLSSIPCDSYKSQKGCRSTYNSCLTSICKRCTRSNSNTSCIPFRIPEPGDDPSKFVSCINDYDIALQDQKHVYTPSPVLCCHARPSLRPVYV